MPTEVWVGFIGLLLGSVLGFIFDMIINNRRMKFEAYKDTKLTLNQLHNKMVELHSIIQQFYINNRDNNPRQNLLDLKDFHWKVMELYKEYRIYFGDLKVYELQSAVYNYYYELAKVSADSNEFDNFYFIGYQALKDAYGLMINEVKLGLVSVNFIKNADRQLDKNKIEEYKKYSIRLKGSLESDLTKKIESITNNNDKDPLTTAARVVKDRIPPFESEFHEQVK